MTSMVMLGGNRAWEYLRWNLRHIFFDVVLQVLWCRAILGYCSSFAVSISSASYIFSLLSLLFYLTFSFSPTSGDFESLILLSSFTLLPLL